MAASDLPQKIPQDLLLIQEIVGGTPGIDSSVVSRTRTAQTDEVDDDDDSSGSDYASQHEIEAQLLTNTEESNWNTPESSVPGDPISDVNIDSDSDPSSDSDSNLEADTVELSGDKNATKVPREHHNLADEEDECSAAVTYHRTRNEVDVTDITIPDIEEVGFEETLEKVGEIMSIVDTVVIVQGMAAENPNRASEKALDSDTLLVFEDRKVMGYVYETFGPTTQPYYQVRFNESYPLDPTKIWVSREVFHVPRRSRFVFLKGLKNVRGSDASNIHDEEPGDDEIEFSDDEQEAAYKKWKKLRGMSLTSSTRLGTPSQLRDQDLKNDDLNLGTSTDLYDEHGPYDMDFTASVTRPPPMPYDDPYSDVYGTETTEDHMGSSSNGTNGRGRRPEYHRGRGRGRGKRPQRAEQSPLRGRDSGRVHRDRRRQSSGRIEDHHHHPGTFDEGDYSNQLPNSYLPSVELHERQSPQLLSPTSFVTPPATGRSTEGSVSSPPAPMGATWQMQHHANYAHSQYQVPFGFDPQGFPSQYVQPHINPRFATAFGFNITGVPVQQPYAQFGLNQPPVSPHEQGWTTSWSAYRETDDQNRESDPS